MKHFSRLLLGLLLIICIALAGVYIGQKLPALQPADEKEVTALLTSVQKVLKLATAEGQVSEVYTINKPGFLDLPLLGTKVLIKVDATVSVGYDLQLAKIDVDGRDRVVTIADLPPPQILSVDHHIDYYDISEGLFADLDARELSDISSDAKETIRGIAARGPLPDAAAQELDEILATLRDLLDAMGYTLEVSHLSVD